MGVRLSHCDLLDTESIHDACSRLKADCPQWDVLVMCPGTLDPIGAFDEVSFDEWNNSLTANFSGQMRVVHELLPSRRGGSLPEPCVIFFAGGGTNDAPVNYSSYIISKIAMIKMCELLDAEISDARFAIVGPGWVRTKILDSTLRASERAGENLKYTEERLAGENWTSTDRILEFCDWVLKAPRIVVSGRNFSLVSDKWGTTGLDQKLIEEPNMYKLRRFGNNWSEQ